MPLVSAISTFNGAVLIIGGILATYTLLAGTLGTAHDGEMLGKKFSSVWIPIRYSLELPWCFLCSLVATVSCSSW